MLSFTCNKLAWKPINTNPRATDKSIESFFSKIQEANLGILFSWRVSLTEGIGLKWGIGGTLWKTPRKTFLFILAQWE